MPRTPDEALRIWQHEAQQYGPDEPDIEDCNLLDPEACPAGGDLDQGDPVQPTDPGEVDLRELYRRALDLTGEGSQEAFQW